MPATPFWRWFTVETRELLFNAQDTVGRFRKACRPPLTCCPVFALCGKIPIARIVHTPSKRRYEPECRSALHAHLRHFSARHAEGSPTVLSRNLLYHLPVDACEAGREEAPFSATARRREACFLPLESGYCGIESTVPSAGCVEAGENVPAPCGTRSFERAYPVNSDGARSERAKRSAVTPSGSPILPECNCRRIVRL
jgi:hypothetical protein